MIKRVALGILALATALAIAPSARADSVSGALVMGGLNTYNGTGIHFNGQGHVFFATESLAVMLTNPMVTMTNFQFATAPGTMLFDWNHGGTDITMTILSFTVVKDTATFLNTYGIAKFTQTGLSPVDYEFTLTSTVSGLTSYALDASPVPEPGSLFLVGSGLLGLAGLLVWKARKPTKTMHCRPSVTQ